MVTEVVVVDNACGPTISCSSCFCYKYVNHRVTSVTLAGETTYVPEGPDT